MRWLEFGSISVRKICNWLFWIGAAAQGVGACIIGMGVAATTTMTVMVENAGWYTGQVVPNNPLGATVGLLAFVLGVLLLRLLCEMLYIVLNFFQSNTKHEAQE